ncbi:flagellar hook-length control protein FliK [Noviherbaspirillum pedocola]|uniref:Flagellar hook-length control protein FliK n=1 Tax=Noviherbaspirillum pedocola TaxID=2801341 RepID=A0A934W1X5_9BURK|nr:flagellar hook-length control protein FliK [Noviherbaspirillum pedocola]MBK4735686.1 flagellar hook-length control protein FliK [Noviherbaspirillum pedocola]
MSVDPSSLAAALQLPSSLLGTAPLLRFQADGRTQRSLDLGEVLAARVTQAFQGGRYLIDIGGQERIVDSTVPLRVGDMLRARVLRVGEQVVLEKLADVVAGRRESAHDPAQATPPPWLERTDNDAALMLFQQHAALLGDMEWQNLGAQTAGLDPYNAVLSALTLKRAGFALNAALLQSLGHALSGASLVASGQQLLNASLVAGAAGMTQAAVRENAQTLTDAIDTQLHAMSQAQFGATGAEADSSGDGMDEGERERWAWIAQRLLNAQQPGSLAHRTMSLPLAINGRLVEFQVALFDVSADAELRPELRQRSLRIALDLDQVGRIEILARVVDRRVVLNVLAASDSTAAAIGDQDSALARALANLGWTVDAVSYEVRPSASGNALIRTVMERLVAGDNFNLLA